MIATTAYNTGVNSTYAEQLTTTKGINAQFNQGLSEQGGKLNALIASTYKTMGSNAELRAEQARGTEQLAQFNSGVADADTSMLNMVSDTAHATGYLQGYTNNLATGAQQAAEFGAGQVKAAQDMANLVGETANLQGQYSILKEAMTNAGAAQIEFNNGVAKGQVDTANMVLGLSAAKGEYVGTHDALLTVAASMGKMSQATGMSNEALTQWIGVIKQAPEAIQKTLDVLTDFVSQAGSKLADALNKGKGDVKKAIKSIEEEMGRKLTAPEKKVITVEAQTQNAVKAIQEDMSLAFAEAKNGMAAGAKNSIDSAMQVAQQQLKAATGPMVSMADCNELPKCHKRGSFKQSCICPICC